LLQLLCCPASLFSLQINFEEQGDIRGKETLIQMETRRILDAEDVALGERRAKLKKLLESEDGSLISEATAAVETPLERQVC
jgi:uncharacterized protein YbaR (Trm112 family)